jgi:hypothetical protein
MADIVSVGFKGTVNELNWSDLGSLLGHDRATTGVDDVIVTPSGTKGQFSISAGGLYGDGILGTTTGPSIVPAVPLSPANGQWYLIVQNRDWGTRTSQFVVRNGPTTSASAPTATVPDSFPASVAVDPGSSSDTAVAWVWVGSAAAQPVVVQLALPPESVYPRRGTQGRRDALTSRLSNTPQGQRYLQDLGLEWYRTDLAWTEVYRAGLNATAGIPGASPGETSPAGWYPVTGALPLLRDWRSQDGSWNTRAGGTQSVTWNGTLPIARNVGWDRVNLTPLVGGRYRVSGGIGMQQGSGFAQVILYINGMPFIASQGCQVNKTTNLLFDFVVPLVVGDRMNIATRSEQAGLVMDARDAANSLLTFLDVEYVGQP